VIRLYHGSGSQGIELDGTAVSADQWAKLRQMSSKMLRARKLRAAADLLDELPFELREAHNGFGDEFWILYWRAPFEPYEKAAQWADDRSKRVEFEAIAKAVQEVTSQHIRFIAVELNTDEVVGVPTPNLHSTSDVVDRALRDAEQLLATTGATSGVDRVHTAFHGYLKVVCDKAGIAYAPDASLTTLFKLVREQHPAFTTPGPRAEEIKRFVMSFASAVDALNIIRNQASVAHPSAALLEGPEAMLLINGVRTLLQYLDSKIG
jgi:hypothetical protein